MKEFGEFEFTQRFYFFELDRKQQLENNISLPTGTIVAALGVLGYYFTHFHFGGIIYKISYFVELLFIGSAVAAGLLLAFATYWCFQAAVGSTYEYLPGSETLRQYLAELTTWHGQSQKRTASQKAKIEFEGYLIKSMARCS